MKKSIYPILSLALLVLLAILTTGCPVGTAHPICEAGKVEKLDKKLLGTWKCKSNSAEILEVKIVNKDDKTFGVEVLEKGENYMADITRFSSWTTKLDGKTFLFSQAAEGISNEFFLYHYDFEGKKLIIQDVGLLVGGKDAVTSTEAYRREVSASLKMPDCLSARLEYVKQ